MSPTHPTAAGFQVQVVRVQGVVVRGERGAEDAAGIVADAAQVAGLGGFGAGPVAGDGDAAPVGEALAWALTRPSAPEFTRRHA